MQLTYFGANSWLVQTPTLNILIDPWLVGSLTFGGAAWFFEGKHRVAPQPPDRIDLILLSQGLEDHSHRATLTSLDRTIPVVGSVSAAKVATSLGYSSVIPLIPGQSHHLGDLTIEATTGASVPQIENGYILRNQATGQSLYYEPHGFSPADLDRHAPIDAVITPIISLSLPLVGPIIKGDDEAVKLARSLQARYLLPTAAGGDIAYTGILDKFLKVQGNAETMRHKLQAAGLTTQVIEPLPNQAFALT
jgi:L-ascorbate metabolism protein UlaG (beta-lactamase superfamily)